MELHCSLGLPAQTSSTGPGLAWLAEGSPRLLQLPSLCASWALPPANSSSHPSVCFLGDLINTLIGMKNKNKTAALGIPGIRQQQGRPVPRPMLLSVRCHGCPTPSSAGRQGPPQGSRHTASLPPVHSNQVTPSES